MRIIGVDLHTRQQTVAMWDTETRELIERTLTHDGDEVRKFYSALPGQVLVGIEATGSMHWFLDLLEKLGIDHQVGHPSEIRKAETRKQKHDRRDADKCAGPAKSPIRVVNRDFAGFSSIIRGDRDRCPSP